MTAKFELNYDSFGDDQVNYKSDEDSSHDVLKALYAQSHFIENCLFGKKEIMSDKKPPTLKTRAKNERQESKGKLLESKQFSETGNRTWKMHSKSTRKMHPQTSIEMQLNAIQKENMLNSMSLMSNSNRKHSEESFRYESDKFSASKNPKNKKKVCQLTFGDLKVIEGLKVSKPSHFSKMQTPKSPNFEICARLDAFDALRFRF